MSRGGFTKKSTKPYTFYDKDGTTAQLPTWMVEKMVEQALNKFGFDVATLSANKEAQNLAKDYEDYLIEKDLRHYKETVKTAEELSLLLVKGRQLINHPIGYALDRAKEGIRKDYSVSNAYGGLLNKQIAMRYAGQQLLETSIGIAKNSADTAVNRYCTLQEDYLTQQAYSNITDTIDRLKGLGGSVINGVVSGFAVAGVAGAAIGGVSSIVSFGVKQYNEYQKRMSSYYQTLNSNNFQTEYSASRLGLTNNGRGTEN